MLSLALMVCCQPQTGTAMEFLSRAATAQQPDRAAGKLLPVEGFSLSLNIRERDQQRNDIDLLVEYARADGGRVKLVLDDPNRGVSVAKGFDGNSYWLQEKGGEEIDLSSREFTQDREAIDQAIELCERLRLMFDLNDLAKQAIKPQLKERGKQVFISGSIRHQTLNHPFELVFDGEHHRLDSLQLWIPLLDQKGRPAVDQQGKALWRSQPRFTLSHYRNFEGLLAPQLIREFAPGPVGEPPIRLIEIHALKWKSPPPVERNRSAQRR